MIVQAVRSKRQRRVWISIGLQLGLKNRFHKLALAREGNDKEITANLSRLIRCGEPHNNLFISWLQDFRAVVYVPPTFSLAVQESE